LPFANQSPKKSNTFKIPLHLYDFNTKNYNNQKLLAIFRIKSMRQSFSFFYIFRILAILSFLAGILLVKMNLTAAKIHGQGNLEKIPNNKMPMTAKTS
jgi:hypothetical protein